MAERVAISELRRWCPIAKTHQDANDPVCGWGNGHEGEKEHRLRSRRMLVCQTCQQGYFNRKEFNEHECYSAY
jgi:hypothetical protein